MADRAVRYVRYRVRYPVRMQVVDLKGCALCALSPCAPAHMRALARAGARAGMRPRNGAHSAHSAQAAPLLVFDSAQQRAATAHMAHTRAGALSISPCSKKRVVEGER